MIPSTLTSWFLVLFCDCIEAFQSSVHLLCYIFSAGNLRFQMADNCNGEMISCEATGNIGGAAVESHVVEIPVDEEKQSSLPYSSPAKQPLEEIGDSKGHLLLLKLW